MKPKKDPEAVPGERTRGPGPRNAPRHGPRNGPRNPKTNSKITKLIMEITNMVITGIADIFS